jgi:ABC-type multidrug transport system fused ATPase/permease subunit
MRYILILFMLVWSSSATSQAMYSKTTEFSALRVSHTAIQSVLDKAGSLASTANEGLKPEREEVILQANKLIISLSGRQLLGSPAKIPDQVDKLSYAYFAASRSPISQLELDFSGYRRSLTVRGSSADQVDALFALLSADITALSHPIGGGALQTIISFVSMSVLLPLCVIASWNWYVVRSRRYGIVPIVLTLIIILVQILPFDQFLAGFLAVRGDPSMFVRYGAEITIFSITISILGLLPMLSPFLFRKQKADSSAIYLK